MFAKKSREQKLIDLMKRKQGAGNDELNRVMFRYGSAIHRLRKDGHLILTIQIKKGYYKYFMED